MGLVAALSGCAKDDVVEPPAHLRDVPDTLLLEEVALDGRYCVLTPVTDEGEAAIEGNTGYVGQTFFELLDGAPNGNNVTISIDHFPSDAEAEEQAISAGDALATLVGDQSTDEGRLGQRDGSVVHSQILTDFEGRPRGTFAASVPIGDAVVRIGSFGVTTIPNVTTFARVAEHLISGLIGDTDVDAVPACGS